MGIVFASGRRDFGEYSDTISYGGRFLQAGVTLFMLLEIGSLSFGWVYFFLS